MQLVQRFRAAIRSLSRSPGYAHLVNAYETAPPGHPDGTLAAGEEVAP